MGREPLWHSDEVQRHLALLRDVSQAVTGSTGVDELIAAALRAITRRTGHEYSAIHLLAPDGECLELAGERGMPDDLRTLDRVLPVGEGLIGKVAATGQGVAIEHLAESPDLRPAARPIVEREGIVAFVCLPIISHGRILGAISVGRRAPRPFKKREVSLVQATADQVALALENVWLSAQTRRQLDDVRRAEAQLIRSDRLSAVGRLAAGAAHEVRNPLTTILGQAQLILAQPRLPARVREKVNIIIGETSRAAQILQNLLAFSRQEAPTRRPCSVVELVTRVLELARFDLQHAGVKVDTDVEADPEVWVDAAQIHQVVLNLVRNAEQAMANQPGDRRLTVRVHGTENGARIEVLDTGPGIPADVLPRIFDPFFTTKPEGEGTGLGLWIVYSIVEQHGGRITAANRAEGGAAFTLELRNRRS